MGLFQQPQIDFTGINDSDSVAASLQQLLYETGHVAAYDWMWSSLGSCCPCNHCDLKALWGK